MLFDLAVGRARRDEVVKDFNVLCVNVNALVDRFGGDAARAVCAVSAPAGAAAAARRLDLAMLIVVASPDRFAAPRLQGGNHVVSGAAAAPKSIATFC